MMDFPFDTTTLIAIPLIALCAYIILGISGFGSALVSIPLMTHVLPLTIVVPLVVMADFIASMAQGIRFRGEMDRDEIRRVIPAALVGIVIGVTVLASVSTQWLLLILGVFVTSYGVYRLLGVKRTVQIGPRWGIVAGLAGGAIGGVIGVGGPIYAAYMSARMQDPGRMRATISVIFTFSTGVRVVLYFVSGLMLQKEIWWALPLMIPSMVVGLYIGHHLHINLSRDQVLRTISLLLVASGTSVLVRVFG
jgi:uncharacterized membrane protein YfcA